MAKKKILKSYKFGSKAWKKQQAERLERGEIYGPEETMRRFNILMDACFLNPKGKT